MDQLPTALHDLAVHMLRVSDHMELVANEIHLSSPDDQSDEEKIMVSLWKHASELRGAADQVDTWVNGLVAYKRQVGMQHNKWRKNNGTEQD